VTEKSPSYKVDELPPLEKANIDPLPWEHGAGSALVLAEMGMTGDEKVMLVSVKVVEMTMESKAGDYQAVRGYLRVAPENLWAHIPVYSPGQLVNDGDGNVGMLREVYRVLAKALDAEVYHVASERADQAVAAKDVEVAVRSQRFDAGKGVVAAKQTGETL